MRRRTEHYDTREGALGRSKLRRTVVSGRHGVAPPPPPPPLSPNGAPVATMWTHNTEFGGGGWFRYLNRMSATFTHYERGGGCA